MILLLDLHASLNASNNNGGKMKKLYENGFAFMALNSRTMRTEELKTEIISGKMVE